MRVRLTPRAGSDLVAILDYIDTRSPQGARNVKRTIQKVNELIGPSAGGRPAQWRGKYARSFGGPISIFDLLER